MFARDPISNTAEHPHISVKNKIKLIHGHSQLRKRLADLPGRDYGNFQYLPNERPWNHVKDVDVVLPCATQNELSGKEAEVLISAGCKNVAEGSNMGCSQEAITMFETHRKENEKEKAVWFAPGKPS